MRSGAFFFSLLCLVLPASALADGSFCLQTFNIYGPAYASYARERITRAAAELKEEGCGIVQLQELWKQNQFAILDQALRPAGWEGHWADSLRRDRYLTGLGTFVRGRVSDARSELFRANNGDGILDQVRGLSGVQKGFTVIEAALPDAPAITLVNAHTHPTDEPTRIAQMLQLVSALYADPALAERPLFFTADLNATPTGMEYAILRDLLLLRDAYAETHGGYANECTYCAKNRYSWSWKDRVIDYTLYRSGPTQALRATASTINLQGGGEPFSDHYGVRSELRWEERADATYNADAPEVMARRQTAILTLEKAAAKLVGNRNPAIAEAFTMANDFANRLRSGHLSANELRVFLTP